MSKYLKLRICDHDDDDDETCVVCQDGLCQEEEDNGMMIVTLGCGHEYHVGCIKPWLRMKDFCPICKAKVLEQGVNEGN
ncbi:E3 ubiquitin-protein ligase mbr2 [Phtheirospermum japonicum]|uniref:RING-type E3 ubiquitin transferase n=1 Tax=Phtheirospermum japonicum TaxID=374723 RepID=A0A830BNQ7_9LAMI|nr:E3 ubiquitin-protein ligase mbr2 [Phtheirospermum japonicum]